MVFLACMAIHLYFFECESSPKRLSAVHIEPYLRSLGAALLWPFRWEGQGETEAVVVDAAAPREPLPPKTKSKKSKKKGEPSEMSFLHLVCRCCMYGGDLVCLISFFLES